MLDDSIDARAVSLVSLLGVSLMLQSLETRRWRIRSKVASTDISKRKGLSSAVSTPVRSFALGIFGNSFRLSIMSFERMPFLYLESHLSIPDLPTVT